jgi:hypothetical protein
LGADVQGDHLSESPARVVVLASHLEGEGHFRSERYTVKPALCRGDFDYAIALEALWDSDLTIVNVEHDIEVSDAHLDELVACPHGSCAWAYQCHWITTGHAEGIIAAGTGEWAHHLQGGEEWADWSAIGLVKITPEARIEPLRCAKWQELEVRVHRAVARPWHVHGNAADKSGHATHHHW